MLDPVWQNVFKVCFNYQFVNGNVIRYEKRVFLVRVLVECSLTAFVGGSVPWQVNRLVRAIDHLHEVVVGYAN